MKFITLLQRHKSVLFALLGFSFFASCGSYQYVGMSEDGIYGSSESVEYNTPVEDSATENTNGNSYYKDYFKGKANEYSNNDSSVFTDVDEYNGSYDENDQSSDENSYAGWGQNNDSQIVINVQTRPLYWGAWGYPYYNRWGWNNWGWNVGWNNWGWNNWGWNVGWNNWGVWDPFYYDPWISPYWGTYGANYYYRPYRGRSVAYVNGYRNSRSRNSSYRTTSLANRSALSTVSRTRSSANRSSASSSRRSYTTTRPTRTTKTRSTTTRTRSIRNSNGTRTTTRSVRTTSQPTRTTSQPTRTTTRTRSSNSRNSSYSRPRSTSRPTTTRSSSRSSRSRGGGSVRRRN